MRLFRISLAASVVLALAGCGTTGPFGLRRESLPTSVQVKEFVRRNWAVHEADPQLGYARRFANAAGRRGERPALVEVGQVTCGYSVGLPRCWFDVSATFEGGETSRQELRADFLVLPDGSLEEPEYIVLIEATGPGTVVRWR